MRKLLSFFALLLWMTTFCSGQLLYNNSLLGSVANGSAPLKTYVDVPVAPTFTGGTTTFTQAGVGTTIVTSEFGGNTDAYIGSDFDQIVFNGITSTTTKRIKDSNWSDPDPANWHSIGIAATNPALWFTNGSRNFEFYNIKTTLRSQGVRHDSPQATDPPNVSFQNTFHLDHAGAGFQPNVQSTGTNYGRWKLNFVVINNAAGNEGIYMGNTTHELNKTMFLSSIFTHVYVDSTWWDGFQLNNHDSASVNHITVRHAGRGDVASQDRGIQLENSFFYLRNSIIQSDHGAFAFLTTSGVVENNFVQWGDNTQGLITDLSNNNHNDAIIDEDASTTSLDISALTIGDTITVTTASSGLNYKAEVNGLCFRSSAAASTNYIFGQVVSYSGTTLMLRVLGFAGSGSHSDWNIEGALIFYNNVFYNPSFTGSAPFDTFENATNIFWEGNTFPASGTSVWEDSRTTNDGYLIQHFDDTFTDTPPTPTFSDPPESYLAPYEQVVSDDYWYYRGCGFRNPIDTPETVPTTPTLVSAKWIEQRFAGMEIKPEDIPLFPFLRVDELIFKDSNENEYKF